MNHKTSELEGALLDAAVAKAAGYPYLIREVRSEDLRCRYDACLINKGPVDFNRRVTDHVFYSPSREWKDGGPIIDREQITVSYDDQGGRERGMWNAYAHNCATMCQSFDSPLIAAMRAFVASKVGSEIDLS